jgi:phosphatidylserine/phosphatidylglycerophosphate/cardiolipin synthase-like enzyme
VLKSKKDIVTIITNNEKSALALENQGKTIRKIGEMGYKITTTRKTIHAKIYLFDDNIILLGSSNLTRNGFFKNSEIEVVLFGEGCKTIKKILDEICI